MTEPLAVEHSEATKNSRAAADTLELHIQWARSSWLGPLCASIGVLGDMVLMEKMGLTVRFPSAIYGAMAVDSPTVALQDSMSSSAVRFLTHLLQARTTSMMFYSHCFPGALAPLLSTDDSVVKETMDWFKLCIESWQAARTSDSVEIQSLASQCQLDTKYMTAIVNLTRASGWTVSEPVREMLRATFTALLNEKLIEDANQKIRDSESRDNCSKVMKHMTQWAIPKDHDLLKAYGREQVCIDTSLPTRNFGDHERLFEMAFEEGKTKETLPLANILEERTWNTYNSVTLKTTACSLELIRVMHSTGDWTLADKVCCR